MDRKLLTTTTLAGLRPRGIGGRRTLDTWNQIDSYLRSSLGDEYADVFSEPVSSESGEISWYGAAAGDVRGFSQLDPQEREELLEKLEQRIAPIRDEATRLASSNRPEEQRLGVTLEYALSVPSPEVGGDFLYSADGEPVLINWGTREDVPDPAVGVLQDFIVQRRGGAAQPTPSRSPQAAERAGTTLAAVSPHPFAWWYLLWIPFVLALLFILYLLLIGCGLPGWFHSATGGVWLDYCPGAVAALEDGSETQRERDRTEHLRNELAELEQRLNRLPRCSAPRNEQANRLDSEDTEGSRRREEMGGTTGDITITLYWDSPSDLDLQVTCPNGDRVYYKSPSTCGGVLDIDANARSENLSASPAENIYFETGRWQPGRYTVEVGSYQSRPSRNLVDDFVVEVMILDEVKRYEGNVRDGEETMVVEFEVP